MRLFWPTVDMLVGSPPFVPPPGACLLPRWFPSLGPIPAADLRLDTGSLRGEGLEGSGVVFQQGPGAPEIAVFVFESGTLAGDVRIQGPRPAALLFRGDACIRARIDARGAGARRGGPGLAAEPGGGGGFGGRGGAPGGTAHGGGPSYGLSAAFEVGTGGQPAASAGGLGGGGLQLGAAGRLVLEGARLVADGHAAQDATTGAAGGGGSGGVVVLHGSEVLLDRRTTISVRGGNGGGTLGNARGGGGGGGGFVLGASDRAGTFDPNGARFVTEGGRGGGVVGEMVKAAKEGGRKGSRGVVFLAGRRDPRAAASFPLPTEDRARAAPPAASARALAASRRWRGL